MGVTTAQRVLLASGLGDDTGGGIFALDAGGFSVIDRVSTTGLSASHDGSWLARLTWTDDDPQTAGELLLYDRRGVRSYGRIDALQEPHGVAFQGNRLVVVSTLQNSVLWLDTAGEVVRTWKAPGDGDCWHLNNVVVHAGRVLVSAFGRFDHHRAWTAPGARDGAGIVIDTRSGKDVLGGLSAPHDPTPLDDGWLICNSGSSELLRLDRAGAVLDRRALGGWTRGLACDTRRLYVGISAHRLSGGDGTAEVVALDRTTLTEVDRWPLPCREVFSLVLVDPALAEGVRVGFDGNQLRARERAQLGPGSGSADTAPLDPADCRVRVEVARPVGPIVAGRSLTLCFHAINHGGAVLRSSGARPILIGGRWFADGEATPIGEGRARLSEPVLPGAAGRGLMRLVAPAEPGNYRLRVGVVQDHVGWFDDIDATLAAEYQVNVVALAPKERPSSRRLLRLREWFSRVHAPRAG